MDTLKQQKEVETRQDLRLLTVYYFSAINLNGVIYSGYS